MTNQQNKILAGLIQSITHLMTCNKIVDNISIAAEASKHLMCQYCPLYRDQNTLCGSDKDCSETIYNYLEEGETK